MSKRSRDVAFPTTPRASEAELRERKRQRLRSTLDTIEEYLEDTFGDDWENVSNSRRCEYRKMHIQPYIAKLDFERARQRERERTLAGERPFEVPEGAEVIDLTGDTSGEEDEHESSLEEDGEPEGSEDGEDSATAEEPSDLVDEAVKQESEPDEPLIPKRNPAPARASPWSPSQVLTPQDPFIKNEQEDDEQQEDNNGLDRPPHPAYKDPIRVRLRTAEDYENYQRQKRIRFDIMFPRMRD